MTAHERTVGKRRESERETPLLQDSGSYCPSITAVCRNSDCNAMRCTAMQGNAICRHMQSILVGELNGTVPKNFFPFSSLGLSSFFIIAQVGHVYYREQ